MKIPKTLLKWTLSLALLSTASAAEKTRDYPSSNADRFMSVESNNDYKPDTTVQETFRPSKGNIFEIPYLEMPASRLAIVDSGLTSPQVRRHLFFEKDGVKMVRFFIHPDSQKLYEPLIKEFGIAGHYAAAPTASTRTLLSWNPHRPDLPPLFLKLSLAQVQDNLGRIIPGWEVRRSVGISEAAGMTSAEIWKKSGASLIPEFAGVYVKTSEGLAFHVDAKQGNVFEHGLIARDASFLDEYPGKMVVPLFSLFSKGPNGEDPIIIQEWRKSGKSWVDFLDVYFFQPFIAKNRYLMLYQGIIPEIHGQNVVVVLDPQTHQIEHFLHRDIGSMKVDLQLRWLHNLSVEPMRSGNAAFDFKFADAPDKIDGVYRSYLHDWIFMWGYKSVLEKYVPDYNTTATRDRLMLRVSEEIQRVFPLKFNLFSIKPRNIGDHLRKYYEQNVPADIAAVSEPVDQEALIKFIYSQHEKGQFMKLPTTWTAKFNLPVGGAQVTKYGIVYRSKLDPNVTLLIFRSDKKTESFFVHSSSAVMMCSRVFQKAM